MTIGKRIKARRIELMMSQRELSDRMGYSNHSTITRIEAGKVDIPQSRIVQFAEVLGVSVPYLMGWEEKVEENPVGEANKLADLFLGIEMKETDEDVALMLEEFMRLDKSKQAQVREYVHFLLERS